MGRGCMNNLHVIIGIAAACCAGAVQPVSWPFDISMVYNSLCQKLEPRALGRYAMWVHACDAH